MQPVKLRQTAPVAAIERVAVAQIKGHRRRLLLQAGDHHHNILRHPLCQQAEEVARQVGPLAAHRVGVGVTGVDKIPLIFAQLTTQIAVKRKATLRHLLALFTQLFALARHQRVQEILKIAVATVMPVILTAEPGEPVGLIGQQQVRLRIGKVDVRAT